VFIKNYCNGKGLDSRGISVDEPISIERNFSSNAPGPVPFNSIIGVDKTNNAATQAKPTSNQSQMNHMSNQASSFSEASFSTDPLKYEDESCFHDLYSINIGLPNGFNKNVIAIEPMDVVSIIAFALGSNLYVEGLMKVNYMDLANRLTYAANSQ